MRLPVLLSTIALAVAIPGPSLAQDAEADADVEASADPDAQADGEEDSAIEDDAEQEGSEEQDAATTYRPESDQQIGSSACALSAGAHPGASAWLRAAALVALAARSRRRLLAFQRRA